MAADRKEVCMYFAAPNSQGCPYGAMCNFSHDVPSQTMLTMVNPSAESQRPDTAGCQQGRHRRQYNRRDARSSHQRADWPQENLTYLEEEQQGGARKPRHQKQHQTQQPGNPHQRDRGRQAVQNQRICRYFLAGFCRNGPSCRFSHEVFAAQEESSAAEVPASSSVEVAPSRNICKYFNSVSGCRLGARCRFSHIQRGEQEKIAPCNQIDATSEASQTENQVARSAPRAYHNPKNLEMGIEEMTEEQQQEARNTEIDILKKRYPEAIEEATPGKGGMAYQIKFTPTDPDWPYDVKKLDLTIHFPPSYPKEMMAVTVPENVDIPETVRRCIGFSIGDWVSARFQSLQKKGRVERVFRPFLRWLDRELEEIFTDALTHYKKELIAKASGIEVIPARHLQAKFSELQTEDQKAEDPTDDPEQQKLVAATDQEHDDNTCIKEESQVADKTEGDEQPLPGVSVNTSAKGTEVRLKDLQMGTSVATLSATTVKLVLSCSRCKEKLEVSTPADRANSANCSKCGQTTLVRYRASLAHSFSSVIGYLDLELCSPVDLVLVDCDFVVSCLNCNKGQKVGGIPPGQLHNVWCSSCHTKLSLATECAQFRYLQPTAIEDKSIYKVVTAKAIKNVRDPAIKEGRPLPAHGTCKHYKKSFRWLRFPCCGKAYPCDICHDTKEGLDHEMKFANRMICGFCAKEQPFAASKPCSGCSSSMTQRSTEHWEGGKGCRDVIRMSRNDDKKYSNTNKTVSRHARAQAENTKKTKPRHS